ncbi:hypothetical protein P7C70_g3276, partial [Phenoliferia sp. Uapishka_3]
SSFTITSRPKAIPPGVSPTPPAANSRPRVSDHFDTVESNTSFPIPAPTPAIEPSHSSRLPPSQGPLELPIPTKRKRSITEPELEALQSKPLHLAKLARAVVCELRNELKAHEEELEKRRAWLARLESMEDGAGGATEAIKFSAFLAVKSTEQSVASTKWALATAHGGEEEGEGGGGCRIM